MGVHNKAGGVRDYYRLVQSANRVSGIYKARQTGFAHTVIHMSYPVPPYMAGWQKKYGRITSGIALQVQ